MGERAVKDGRNKPHGPRLIGMFVLVVAVELTVSRRADAWTHP